MEEKEEEEREEREERGGREGEGGNKERLVQLGVEVEKPREGEVEGAPYEAEGDVRFEDR